MLANEPTRTQPKYSSLFSSGIVANVFPDIETGHAQHQRVLAGLQQVDQYAEELVILFVQALRILTPELALVHRGPFQASRFHLEEQKRSHTPARMSSRNYLGCVLIERTQILHRSLQPFGEELDVSRHVFVVEFALFQDGQLLQYLTRND